MSNYAIKRELTDAIDLDISNLAAKSNFISLKAEVDKLQPQTRYLRKTLVLIWNSAPREKFNFYFQGVFC